MQSAPRSRRATLSAFAAALALIGCQDDEIRVYDAPKAASAPTAPAVTPAAEPRIGWTVPAGWRRLPGTQPLRVATFVAGDGAERLEISVSSFAGAAGGTLANVNRWRGQIGLAPIAEATLANDVTPLTTVGGRGFLVRLAGADAARHVLAAILPDHGGSTWFVKATGPATVLDRHADELRSFAMSFDPSAPAAAQPVPQPSQGAAEPATSGAPTWTVPTHWSESPPASSLVAAAFSIPTDGPDGAKVTVTPLSGEAGGLLANLNRWRGQVGLPPVADAADQPMATVDVDGIAARVVELVGPAAEGAPARALAVALVRQPGADRTWYLRLAGPAPAVAAQREGFLGFVRSLRFPAHGGAGR